MPPHILLLLTLCLGGLLPLGSRPAHAQSPPSNSTARITVERSGDMFTICPTYVLPNTASDTTALQYEFTVERTGASTSRSRQGGTFTPVPGRIDTLSTSRINAEPGDRLHLHLIVRRTGAFVAEVTRTEEIPVSN